MGSAAAQTIDRSDLREPRLTEVQRQILDDTDGLRVDFAIDRMVDEAIAEAGADDFDDADGFFDRLRAHVHAIEADEGLRQLNRLTLRQRIVRLLRNRLSLNDLLRRYPEISSLAIEKPFIVVGMPRSWHHPPGESALVLLTRDGGHCPIGKARNRFRPRNGGPTCSGWTHATCAPSGNTKP